MIIFFCQSNNLVHWQIALKSIFMLQMVFIFNFIHDCLSNSSNYTVCGSALTSSFPEHSLCPGLLCKLVEESSPVMDLVVLSYNTAETPRRLLELGQQSREVFSQPWTWLLGFKSWPTCQAWWSYFTSFGFIFHTCITENSSSISKGCYDDEWANRLKTPFAWHTVSTH